MRATILEVARGVALPSPDLVRLAALVCDPEQSADDLARLVRTSPELAAALLRIANSALHAGPEITDINSAIVRVGTHELNRLAWALLVDWTYLGALPGYAMTRDQAIEHAVSTAVATELCAIHSRQLHPSMAYTAGLLVDIGKLAVGAFLENALNAVLKALHHAPERGFDAAERAVLDIDHAEAGAELAERWGLPAPLVTCIRYHHRPAAAPEHMDLVYHTHVGDTVARIAGTAFGTDGISYPFYEDGLRRIGLEGADVERIAVLTRSRTDALLESVQSL